MLIFFKKAARKLILLQEYFFFPQPSVCGVILLHIRHLYNSIYYLLAQLHVKTHYITGGMCININCDIKYLAVILIFLKKKNPKQTTSCCMIIDTLIVLSDQYIS